MALLQPSYGQAGAPITTATLPGSDSQGNGTGGGGLLKGDPNSLTNPQFNFSTLPALSLSDPQGAGVSFVRAVNAQAANPIQQANALSPTNLLPGQRNFSDQTQNEITEFGNNASNAGQNLIDTMNGTEGAAAPISNTIGHQASTNQALGMASNPDLAAALSRTANNRFQNTLQGMKANLAFQAPTYQSQQQAQYGQYLAANEQNKNQNYQQQVAYQTQQQQLFQQWQQAQDNAKNGAISSILGGLGTVAGAAIGAL